MKLKPYKGSLGEATSEIRNLRNKLILGEINQEMYDVMVKPYIEVLEKRGEELKNEKNIRTENNR